MLNISAYKFVALDDLAALRTRIHALADGAGLKGTVLIATEGINLFLAGTSPAVEGFMQALRENPKLADLETKKSWSERPPFQRLLVKIKPEIIKMNCEAVRPDKGRAPAVSPETLARWLAQGHDDEGRELLLLDTRNAFEVQRGSFRNAVDWKLARFSDFPKALSEHRAELEGKTVVSFCTGGIRCEKAALLMTSAGLPHVYQLGGGILAYLEQQGGQAGGEHYRGECFVFDERLAVDAALMPAVPMAPASPVAARAPRSEARPHPTRHKETST